jgi:hypothetical protein
MYDANVGRFLSKDPRHQYWSPYEGMGNNPVSGTDPTGGFVDPPTASASLHLNEIHIGSTPEADGNKSNGTEWEEHTMPEIVISDYSFMRDVTGSMNRFTGASDMWEGNYDGANAGAGGADAYQLSVDVTLLHRTFSPAVTFVPSSGMGIGYNVTELEAGLPPVYGISVSITQSRS